MHHFKSITVEKNVQPGLVSTWIADPVAATAIAAFFRVLIKLTEKNVITKSF